MYQKKAYRLEKKMLLEREAWYVLKEEKKGKNCQEFDEKAWLKEKTCIQTNAWPNANEFD